MFPCRVALVFLEIGVFEKGEPREATWVQLGSTWAPKRSPGRPKAVAKKGAKEMLKKSVFRFIFRKKTPVRLPAREKEHVRNQ